MRDADMDDERSTPISPRAESGDNRSIARAATGVVSGIVSLSGAYTLVRAISGAIDFDVLAMAGLSFMLGPLSSYVRVGRRDSVEVPAVHCVILANAFALGPFGGAIPAASAGISILMMESDESRPLSRVLYCLLRPVALTAAAGVAFTVSGGTVLRPQEVASLLPVLIGTGIYTALALALPAFDGRSTAPASSRIASTASWTMCAAGGYALAALYAVAPSYVIAFAAFGPAAILAAAILRRLRERSSDSGDCPEEQPDEPTSIYLDPATGLANRRYLDMFLEREVGRSQRLRKSLSVAVFNLDDSRNLDAAALDRALGEIGTALAAEVREYDVVARYSEGRIVVVLPEASTDQALEVAERLLERANEASASKRSGTVSCGLAAFPTHADSAHELINAAHHALNKGKFETSDKVHVCRNLAKAG